MRNLILPLAAALMAMAMFSYAATPADAQEGLVVVVTGNGPTGRDAIKDALEKAAEFQPYELLSQEVAPVSGGWVCVLELIPLG